MDIGRAFSFVFEDEKWVTKTLIAVVVAILSILIIPIPLLTGYMVAIARNVANGDETLPEWSDWGRLWMDGLAIIVANIVYTIPFWLIPLILAVPSLLTNNEQAGTSLMSLAVILSCFLITIGVLLLLFISPALVVIYARTGEFGSLFQVGRILSFVQACINPILVALVIGILVSVVASIVGGLLNLIPCIGTILALPVTVYPLMVMGHAYGQVGRQCPTQ